ncbi:MAG: hypothetical protein JRG91_04425 [Deltaproteobacteria bacterium]|nr:hypothetical protein [Deltaproteobacteria bacterium]
MRRTSTIVLAAVLAATCKGKQEPAAVEPEAAGEVDETTGDEMQEPAPEPEREGPLLGREKIRTAGSDAARKLNMKGLLMLRKDLAERAGGKFEEALAEDPGHAAAAYNLACTLSRQGELERAAKMLEKAMRGAFPRFGHKIDDDRDLEPLRASPHWDGVQESRTQIAGAWRDVLASPGTFLLISEPMELTDPYGDVIREEDDQRGNAWFHHTASGRFLPLGSGRTAAGFVLDREGRVIHVLRWNKQIAEMDTIPAQYTHISVVSVDLEDLSSTKIVVPGSATGLVLYVHEGKTVLRRASYKEATAREFWISSEIQAGELEQVGKVSTEPTPIDLSDGEWKGGDAYCASRIGEEIPTKSYLFLDTFCGAAFPGPGTEWEGSGGVGKDEVIQAGAL